MTSDALIAALIELEHHVASAGWDQPARLFALVQTDALIAAEPELAAHLGLRSSADGHPEGALSSIEQDDFRSVGAGEGPAVTESGLPEVLARITWPDAVDGCALAVERSFLPAPFETDLPADPVEAERAVATHPQRQDLRLVVGVLRDGSAHGLARVLTQPDELLSGPDLAPGVVSALAATLDHDQPGQRLHQDSRRTT
ncbi:MAG: PPA1309 family protein [Propionibacteriaceae bacterium]|nr:PPA1309 family protein [Propionibacteriaceae bacterium]